jgi:LAO/AO transport system kinase
MKGALPTLAALAKGEKRVLAAALAAIETAADTDELARLLDQACAAARGHVTGLTGPPGVGKSTLTNVLVARARSRDETVGVIAVDPSSRRTGGALLGDRARIVTDPADRGVYVRSMAARDRLGGLSHETVAAMVLMRAIYHHVIVESVGIGQSEADISFCADTVVLCVQPGAGDSLQFMKAGIMELPDIVVVTKADMVDAARRARADVEGALTLVAGKPGWQVPVVLVAAARHGGIDELEAAIERHRIFLGQPGRLEAQRRAQEEAWIEEAVRSQFGTAGIAAARRHHFGDGDGPFSRKNSRLHRLARMIS